MERVPIGSDIVARQTPLTEVVNGTTETVVDLTVSLPRRLRYRTFWGGAILDSSNPAAEENCSMLLRADFMCGNNCLTSLIYGTTENSSYVNPATNPPASFGVWPTFGVIRPADRFGGKRLIPVDSNSLPGESIMAHFDNKVTGPAPTAISRILVMSPFKFCGDFDSVHFMFWSSVGIATFGVETFYQAAFFAVRSSHDPFG